ncbi:hypothetical protein PARHAE_03436 [Paracoccus haematequi]|uniref:Chaperone protein DnaJ n=1 Tax=Paracoccus haematequi TaxID=2491866 RepID=A0A3S4GSZ1_9RHOB|nr:hypothetical protein [Paracoccus haematequi]VDS10222.1 hypothetical protein PARHAE_03436 [Paracoccus haematequi]
MAQVNCDYCGGYGQLPGKSLADGAVCPKCHGTGKMRVADKAAPPTGRPVPKAKKKGPPIWLLAIGAIVIMVLLGD